jgi:hypothetical protein
MISSTLTPQIDVEITATDPVNGLTDGCFVTLTVVGECARPTLECPGSVQISANEDCEGVVPDLSADITATDNETPPENLRFTQDPPFGTVIDLNAPVAEKGVLVTVEDDAGNKSSCTVTLVVVDDGDPEITSCPEEVVLDVESNCEATVPDLTDDIAVDDVCPGAAMVDQDIPAGSLVGIGDNPVTVTATDVGGNSSSCVVNVKVVDDDPLIVGSEPADETITAGADCMAEVPDFTSQFVVTSECDSSLMATQTPPAGTEVGLGATEVTVLVEDAFGNTAATTVVLTVVDEDAPRIASCAANADIASSAESCDGTVPDLTVEVEAEDCGGISTITQTPPAGTLLDELGGMEVILTVTDEVGNEETCAARVELTDETPPTIDACAADRTLSAGGSDSAAMPDVDDEVLVSDGCSENVQVSQEPGAGASLPIGDTTVTFTATDQAGNETTCQATFTVVPLGSGDFIEAAVLHRGSEHLVAGANVDPSVSLQTPAGYAPGGFGGSGAFGTRAIALSGDGQKVWVAMFDTFPDVGGDPQAQLWSVNTDGTGGTRSSLPADDLRNGLNLSTSLDGSTIIAHNPRLELVYRATSGAAAGQIFDVGASLPGSCIRGNMALSDDASDLIFLSFCDTAVYRVDLGVDPAVGSLVASSGAFQFMGRNADSTSGIIDASSDLNEWAVSMRVFNFDENRNRFPLFVGTGLTNPTIGVQDVPNDFDGLNDINITDDGSVISYCVGVAGTNPCFLQDVGAAAATRTVVMDDVTTSGGGTLSDDGGTMYQQTNICCGDGDSYLYDVASGTHRSPSSQSFSGSPDVRFSGVQLSDDGSILAAPVGAGVYILRTGVDGLTNFPSIDRILYGFNDANCTLIVRVEVTAPRGVERIFTLPLFKGMEPSRSVPEPDNPFFNERDGGGINKSTIFTEVEPGVWERVINIDGFGTGCKKPLITAEYNLRIVLIDANETVSVFQDFAPLP